MFSEERRQEDERITQALARIGHKILVMSGKGGVGKSTVAVNLAVALADAGRRVGLLDVDLHGPTVPVLMGLTQQRPTAVNDLMQPLAYNANLKVLSIGNLLDEENRAIIWRGPMKITAIRQLLADVEWGDLDYLIIDSPPGTGDEPLTVAQTVPGARALVVTTPQEVSLADVRKSIQFCRAVDMPILGLIENMAGYICPKCGHVEPLFGVGGGGRTARQFGLPLLGGVPIDPAIVRGGDSGKPYAAQAEDSPARPAFRAMVAAIERQVRQND
jgi:Mrp family chromosome partitioning ATPase